MTVDRALGGEKLLRKLREQFKDVVVFVVRHLRLWSPLPLSSPVYEPCVLKPVSQIDGEDFGTGSAALNVRQDLPS